MLFYANIYLMNCIVGIGIDKPIIFYWVKNFLFLNSKLNSQLSVMCYVLPELQKKIAIKRDSYI